MAVVESDTEWKQTHQTHHRLDKEQTPSYYCLLVVSGGRKTGRVCDEGSENFGPGGIKASCFSTLQISWQTGTQARSQSSWYPVWLKEKWTWTYRREVSSCNTALLAFGHTMAAQHKETKASSTLLPFPLSRDLCLFFQRAAWFSTKSLNLSMWR